MIVKGTTRLGLASARSWSMITISSPELVYSQVFSKSFPHQNSQVFCLFSHFQIISPKLIFSLFVLDIGPIFARLPSTLKWASFTSIFAYGFKISGWVELLFQYMWPIFDLPKYGHVRIWPNITLEYKIQSLSFSKPNLNSKRFYPLLNSDTI